MALGDTEDLKAIWTKVSSWYLCSADGSLVFDKEVGTKRGSWKGVEGQRKGLDDVILMNEEEWLRKMKFSKMKRETPILKAVILRRRRTKAKIY